MKSDSLSHVGKNIRAIRLRRHLSQTELADRMGMRPGPLNCIEKGRNLPSARVIHSLSRVLDVPTDAFFARRHTSCNNLNVREEPVPYMTSEESPPWSGPCALPARTGKELSGIPAQAHGTVNQLADIFLELEDMAGAVKSAELQLGLAADRTEEGLRRLCTRVRHLLGVGEAVIFDYLELLENSGLRIIFCALPEGTESMSCHDVKNGNAFVFVNAGSRTAERQLFRLSYELGRLYMHAPDHYGNVPPPLIGHDRRGKLFTPDRAARRFSALFLMPEPAVCSTVRQLGIRPDQWTLELLYRIKHRFGVSAEAMLYRLRELRLIVPRLEKELLNAIKKHYAAHVNSEPDSSRRVLTPNGRIWDLALAAGVRGADQGEALRRIKGILKRHGVQKV